MRWMASSRHSKTRDTRSSGNGPLSADMRDDGHARAKKVSTIASADRTAAPDFPTRAELEH